MSYKRLLPVLFLALAFLAILAGLLPGGASPAGALKFVADRFVADRDFEVVTPVLYNRLRPVFLAAGAGLLLFGLALRRGWTTDRPALVRWALGLAAVAGLAFLGAAASLATGGINSPLYRLAAGTPPAFVPPTLTPVPTATATPAATPTPVPLEPGRWDLVLGDILQPVVLTHANDGSGRLFIAIRRGRIRVIENGVLLNAPFLDLRDRSLQEFESMEQGLLGLAFHPNYAENGFFYVYYVDMGQNVVLSRFQVSADDPNRADPDSEHRLFGILKPAADHNGGNLVFGPDGYLYLGTGDGGIQRDPYGYAQSLDSLLGKILRIDVDNGEPYGIPTDNPFVNAAGLDEIYGFGLRNPWRFSFDALTGDLYIGDVGHNEMEEVDFIPTGIPGGFNLGWNHYEGFDFYTLFEEPPVPPLPDHTPPIWTYSHGSGGRCAVVGGYVYRGTDLPALQGTYLFGDFCSGEIWGLRPGPDGKWAAETLFDTSFTIISFGVDARNEIYVLTLNNEIYKLVP